MNRSLASSEEVITHFLEAAVATAAIFSVGLSIQALNDQQNILEDTGLLLP